MPTAAKLGHDPSNSAPDRYCRRAGENECLKAGGSAGSARLPNGSASIPAGPGRSIPPLPIPTWGTGQASTLDEAKAAFREAWERLYPALTPHDIEHWHHHQDVAAERSRA